MKRKLLDAQKLLDDSLLSERESDQLDQEVITASLTFRTSSRTPRAGRGRRPRMREGGGYKGIW